MEQIKLKKLETTNPLAEIFQSINIKFAFVNDKYEQITQPCVCRDFLGDVLWSRVTGNSVKIWGFGYNYKEAPYDTETLRLSLTFPTLETQANFIRNFHYIEQREKSGNIKPLKVILTEDVNTLVIEADKAWQSAVWKLSLFTYYIKKYSNRDLRNLTKPESTYDYHLKPEVEMKLLQAIHNPFVDWATDLGTNHNNRGFVSLIKGNSKKEHAEVFGS